MIAVDLKTTAGTAVQAVAQSEFLPVSATRAVLARVGGVHPDNLPTGAFSLADNQSEERGPRRVTNAFGETAIVDHPVHRKVFDRNCTEPVDDLSGLLMREVLASPADTFVNPRDGFTSPDPFRRSFFGFRKFTLHFSQCPFVRAKESGVLHGFPGGQMREGRESYVDTDSFFGRWKRYGSSDITRERGIPLTRTCAADRTRLLRSFGWAMSLDLVAADFGHRQAAFLEATSGGGLRERHAIVAANSTETGVSGFLPGLHPSEKRFERKVKPKAYILEHLGMGEGKAGALFFEGRQPGMLHVERQRFLTDLISRLSFLEQTVPQPSAFLKLGVQRRGLFSGRKQPILEVLTHAVDDGIEYSQCQAPPYIPALKDGVLRRESEEGGTRR